MSAAIVPTTAQHVMAVCEHLRARERAAFDKLGENPEHMLMKEFSKSILSYTGFIDEKPVIIFGAQVTTIMSAQAYIWIVCAEDIEYFPLTFLRHSREALAMLGENFKGVYGYVMPDFTKSVRWLEWLGFNVSPVKDGVHYFFKEL